MEENFSPQQSFQLIESMIRKVRCDISANRFYFLFWGWISFCAILGQFFLKVVIGYQHHYIVWLCVIPAVIITITHSSKDKEANHKTYVGDSMKYLWMGIGISFFVLSFIISRSTGGWYIAYPFFHSFLRTGNICVGHVLKIQTADHRWCV